MSIVKMAVFTHLYLGPWCEHSVETNKRVAEQLRQHIPVVKSLRERVFTKSRSMGHGAVWKTTPFFLLIINFLIIKSLTSAF